MACLYDVPFLEADYLRFISWLCNTSLACQLNISILEFRISSSLCDGIVYGSCTASIVSSDVGCFVALHSLLLRYQTYIGNLYIETIR
jgi:hypothetical protein